MKQNDYVPTQTTNIQIRIYKQLFVFVVDGKAHGMVTEGFAALFISNFNVPQRPKMDKPKSWNASATVFEDYEMFYFEQLNYHEVKLWKESHPKSVISAVTCDAKAFFETFIKAAEDYILRAENNSCLLPEKFAPQISLSELRKKFAFIKLFYNNFYS